MSATEFCSPLNILFIDVYRFCWYC